MVAIDLITQHIRVKLQQPDLRRIYHNLEVVPSNYQTRGMHTIIRDVQTNKADFVFYADRLLRLVRASAAEALLLSSSSAMRCFVIFAWSLSALHSTSRLSMPFQHLCLSQLST